MKPELVTYLIFSYVLLVLVSILVSLLIYWNKPSPETREAPLYWSSIAFGFIAQALAGQHPTWASLSIFASFPTTIAIASMSRRIFGKGLEKSHFLAAALLAGSAWAIAFSLEAEFWVYTLPAALAVGGLLMANAWLTFDKSVSSRLFSLVVAFSGLHILDYPFFRLDTEFQGFGFMIANLNGFLMAILTPVITLEKLRGQYTSQLESDVNLATQELRKANGELTRAQKEIKGLVRILCHDMANNVTVARFGFELLAEVMEPVIQEKDRPELELKRASMAVRTALESQHNLIINVRLYQSIADGKAELNLKDVDLSQAIDELELLFEHRLASKGIHLHKSLADSFWIAGEKATFINCILGNLLSNAIKFSRANSQIELTVRANASEVILEIRDHGVGMEPERLAEVFSDHHATSTSGTAGEIGTGFGMPIVKAMLERCGGRIEVESRSQRRGATDPGTSMRLFLVRTYPEKMEERTRIAS